MLVDHGLPKLSGEVEQGLDDRHGAKHPVGVRALLSYVPHDPSK